MHALSSRTAIALAAALGLSLASHVVAAQPAEPLPGDAAAPPPAPPPEVVVVPALPAPPVLVGAPSPAVVVAAPPARHAQFVADPVVDGALIGGGLGATLLLSLIIGTGEISPQQISPNFKTSDLLFIDRVAVTQHIDPHAGMYSNIGLYAAVGYAFLDPILTGVRENQVNAALVDAMIYAEAISMTDAVTNVAKLAVRRPRPIAYYEFEQNIKTNPKYTNTSTDSALSFFSGHSSTTGAITATATYLAFARSPHSIRPWLTLFVGTGITTFVSIERVRSGEHFPTDVIAGSLTGAGIGTLVAHLHRTEESKPAPLWIAWKPAQIGQGGSVMFQRAM